MAISFRCVRTIFDDLAGVTDDDAVARHVKVDIGVWCDQNIVADRHLADHNGIRADPDPIPDRRRALALSAVLAPDRHTRRNVAIFPDLRLRIDDDRPVMPDEKPVADLRLGGDVKGILLIQHFQPICIE